MGISAGFFGSIGYSQLSAGKIESLYIRVTNCWICFWKEALIWIRLYVPRDRHIGWTTSLLLQLFAMALSRKKIGHLLKHFREQIRQPKRHKVRQNSACFQMIVQGSWKMNKYHTNPPYTSRFFGEILQKVPVTTFASTLIPVKMGWDMVAFNNPR